MSPGVRRVDGPRGACVVFEDGAACSLPPGWCFAVHQIVVGPGDVRYLLGASNGRSTTSLTRLQLDYAADLDAVRAIRREALLRALRPEVYRPDAQAHGAN